MEDDKNFFSTKDLYLASYLIASGYTWYELEKRGDVFFFNFDKRMIDEKDPGINLAVDEYWARNTSVDPRSLFEAMKELKTRMYNENGNQKLHQNRQ